jgi:hypothetical protein
MSAKVAGGVTYPASHISLIMEGQKFAYSPSAVSDAAIAAQMADESINSLLMCLSILCKALTRNSLEEYRQFILSAVQTILQLSDNHVLWGLAVRYSCLWIAQRRSILSNQDQADIISSFVNLDRWSHEMNAQASLLRVIALVERVSSVSTPHTPSPSPQTLHLQAILRDVPLDTMGLLCTHRSLRLHTINRIRNREGLSNCSLYEVLVRLLRLDWRAVESRYWISALPALILQSYGHTINPSTDASPSPWDVHLYSRAGEHLYTKIPSPNKHNNTQIILRIPPEHPYQAFLASLQHPAPTHGSTRAAPNSKVSGGVHTLACLAELSLLSPVIADSLLKECFRLCWSRATDKQRSLLTHEASCTIARHSFKNTTNWPQALYRSFSPLPQNIPQYIVSLFLALTPTARFSHEFLGAVGASYSFWHDAFDAIRNDLVRSPVNAIAHAQATRVCIGILRDIGDMESMFEIYETISKPRTAHILPLESYGYVREANKRYLEEMMRSTQKNVNVFQEDDKMLLGDQLEPESPIGDSLDLEILEERWLQTAKGLSEWDTLLNYGEDSGLSDVAIEAAMMKGDWTAVRRLKATPIVNALLERGNYEMRLLESMVAVVDQKLPQVSEKICSQSVQLALQKWSVLPSASLLAGFGNHSSAHKNILFFFYRATEVRESIVMMSEIASKGSRDRALPDLKTNLSSWRERLPEAWDGLLKWEQIIQWRNQVFSIVRGMYQSVSDECQLGSLHDTTWSTITLARAARKHHLDAISAKTLIRLQDLQTMDISDAFSKLREEILPCLHSSIANLYKGINMINCTNLDFFDPVQRAELFRLKAHFQIRLGQMNESQESFAQSVQICPSYGKSWLSWAEYCYAAYERSHHNDEAQSVISCVMKGIECNSDVARSQISRVLWVVESAGEFKPAVASFLLHESQFVPVWVWIPYLPTLIASSARLGNEHITEIICKVAGHYPQAVLPLLYTPNSPEQIHQVNQFYRIRSVIQESNPTLLDRFQHCTSTIEKALTRQDLPWSFILFLDEIFCCIVDDCSASLSLPVSPEIVQRVSSFLAPLTGSSEIKRHPLYQSFVEEFSNIVVGSFDEVC